MATIEVDSWKSLTDALHPLPPVDLACRGQGRLHDTGITSKLDRVIEETDLKSHLRIERAVIQRFREHAPNYLSTVERAYIKSRWLQLVVMQHYGAPTRLVDWSKSPWVAAFFAVASDYDDDGVIYVFTRNRLETVLRHSFGVAGNGYVWGPHDSSVQFSEPAWDEARPNDKLFHSEPVEGLSPWVATFYCRDIHFPRLIAQQGFFTFGSRPRLDHWREISNAIPDHATVILIRSRAKREILRRLNAIGLNGATLFPGPDGIGRSLEGFARSWALEPRPSHF